MPYEAFALRRRFSALGMVAAMVGSALLGATAASAGTTATEDSTSTVVEAAGPESAGAETNSAETNSPAELETALAADLGLSPAEFEAQGALAQLAAEAMPQLEALDGFVSISISEDTPAHLIITGTGADVAAAADELGAKLVAPANSAPEPEPAADRAVDPAVDPAVEAAETAPSVWAIFRDYLEIYGPEGVQHLQAIMQDSSGEYIIRMAEPAEPRTGSGSAAPSVEEFESRYTNVDADEADGPADALADTSGDALVGGLGLLAQDPDGSVDSNGSVVCSIGFNAYSPTGDPAILSAGHCSEDGSYTDVSLIDPQATSYFPAPEDLTDLGQFVFSQFGGPDNGPASAEALAQEDADMAPLPGTTGTDVGVIGKVNTDVVQLPAVTDWQDPANVSATGPLVTGTAEPTLGAPICASGRTTGWSCGTVDYVGIFFVQGHNYVLDRTDIRIVEGYGSQGVVSAGGDSGGANISGTLALGVTSAGGADENGVEWTYGASIGPMLEAAEGYTLQVFVEAPVLTVPANGDVVEAGDPIRGTAPAGSNVTVTSGGDRLPVEVDPAGNWSFEAPPGAGVFDFVVQAAKGFSVSAERRYTVIIDEPAPVMPDPVPAEPAGNGTRAGEGGEKLPESPAAAPVLADGELSRLPDTGMSALLPLTAGASVLLLTGAAGIVFGRRRPLRG